MNETKTVSATDIYSSIEALKQIQAKYERLVQQQRNRSKAYYYKHKTKVQARQKAYYQKNKDKIKKKYLEKTGRV